MFVHEGKSLKYLINYVADLGFGKWLIAIFTVLVAVIGDVRQRKWERMQWGQQHERNRKMDNCRQTSCIRTGYFP